MNISTYEARIAALEAQLGPEPGPSGPTTGLLWVTVSPDITLSDNSSLNDALGDLMPIESGDSKTLSITGDINREVDYTVTATPGSEWQIISPISPGTTPGSPVSGGLNVEYVGTTAKATSTIVAGDAFPPTNTAQLILKINID